MWSVKAVESHAMCKKTIQEHFLIPQRSLITWILICTVLPNCTKMVNTLILYIDWATSLPSQPDPTSNNISHRYLCVCCTATMCCVKNPTTVGQICQGTNHSLSGTHRLAMHMWETDISKENKASSSLLLASGKKQLRNTDGERQKTKVSWWTLVFLLNVVCNLFFLNINWLTCYEEERLTAMRWV